MTAWTLPLDDRVRYGDSPHLASDVGSPGDRFPRSTQEPEPRSRHLYAGHRLASTQDPARLIPGLSTCPGFDAISPVSTLHQWFTRVRLHGSHL